MLAAAAERTAAVAAAEARHLSRMSPHAFATSPSHLAYIAPHLACISPASRPHLARISPPQARVAAVTEAAKLAGAAHAQALHREQLGGLGLVRVRVS